jgi:hypothetical protein
MWGWVELTYRAFVFSPPQADLLQLQPIGSPTLMDTENNANPGSSCCFLEYSRSTTGSFTIFKIEKDTSKD